MILFYTDKSRLKFTGDSDSTRFYPTFVFLYHKTYILRFPLISLLVSRLGRKETVPPVPLSNTATAVGTLTLHTGVRNRHMEITSIKNACYIVAGFPTVALC